MVEYPVVYGLAPIGVGGAEEANGEVFYFCSEECREIALAERSIDSDGPIAKGMSADWIDGTICGECNKILTR